MDIRDQLSLALIMRNVKRNPAAPSTEPEIEDVRSYINSFLAYNLPTAIAMDQEVLTLEVDKGLVSPKVWDVLESYVVSVEWAFPAKFIMEDYADEVYKPYLAGSKVFASRGRTRLFVAFYLYQN